MPPDTRTKTFVLKALPSKTSTADIETDIANHGAETVSTISRPGESLKTDGAQAKRKTSAGSKKPVKGAGAPHANDAAIKTKVAAKVLASSRELSESVTAEPLDTGSTTTTAGDGRTRRGGPNEKQQRARCGDAGQQGKG